MELIVISDTRMKIMLTSADLTEYELDVNALDCMNGPIKEKLNLILEEAKAAAGIEKHMDRSLVQVFPSKDGGCEMYVTQYSSLFDQEEGASDVDIQQKQNTPNKRTVYRFEDISTLLSACRALKHKGITPTSDAYMTCGRDAFYLIVKEPRRRELTGVLLEYSAPVFFGGIIPYITEHCMPICEKNAIEVLSGLC